MGHQLILAGGKVLFHKCDCAHITLDSNLASVTLETSIRCLISLLIFTFIQIGKINSSFCHWLVLCTFSISLIKIKEEITGSFV